VDHPRLGGRTHRQLVTLDVAYPDRAQLHRVLQRLLAAEVRHVVVLEVDLVREVIVVDVRFRTSHLHREPRVGSARRARAGGIVTARSRASAVVAASVAGLPVVGLAAVVDRSAPQARVEHKYLVPLERLAELAARLPDSYAVLEVDRLRGFAYQSVYFDTADLLTYRQHLQGRRRRYKVRTRAYLDSGACTFQGKRKGRREQTIKARLPYPVADRARINPQAQAFLADRLREAYRRPAPQLAATVTTAYRRTTLVDLQRGMRLTCDVDLIGSGGGNVAVGLSRHVLVETKRHGPHHDADTALRSLGLRPVEVSKYCVAVALLYPGIRRNPWHRTLQRYFADATPARRPATPIRLRSVPRRRDRQERGRGTAAGRREDASSRQSPPGSRAQPDRQNHLLRGQRGQLCGPQGPMAATNSIVARPRAAPQRAGTLRASSRSQALMADQMASTPRPKPARLTRANTTAAQDGRAAPSAGLPVSSARVRVEIAARASPLSPETRAVWSGATGRALLRMRSS
jgi:Domain of unknown function (DUF4956)/VTC domain